MISLFASVPVRLFTGTDILLIEERMQSDIRSVFYNPAHCFAQKALVYR